MNRWTVCLLAALACTGAARAESLWKPAANGAAPESMVADRKARKVGDLITILVVETSTSSQQANTSVSNKSKVDVSPGMGPILRAIPGFGFDGSTSSGAQGATSRTSNLAARLTVTVKDVKPNGALALEGVRFVKTNNETQVLRITGTVRTDDVQPDNTVLSTYVADAQIELTGRGPIGERQKPGIITRIFKILF